MRTEEIRKLKWVKLEDTEEYEDWNLLPRRSINGKQVIQNSLLDMYLDNVYKQLSRKLNISFTFLSKMIKEENSAFYSLKKEIFRFKSTLDPDSDTWDLLKSYLMIPDVNSVQMIPKLDGKPNNKALTEYISFLSYEERKQLKENLKEFEDNNEKSSVEKIIGDFKKLSDLEKIQVLNSLKLLTVKIEFPTN